MYFSENTLTKELKRTDLYFCFLFITNLSNLGVGEFTISHAGYVGCHNHTCQDNFFLLATFLQSWFKCRFLKAQGEIGDLLDWITS